MAFSNNEALAILRWMVRKRLLETMYEPDAREAFDRKIKDDFAELMETGVIKYAEVTHSEKGIISVRLHRNDCRFVFRASVVDGRVEVERRALYI